MRISLSLKLGVFVVLLFAVVITTCLLWTPVMVRWYLGKFNSADTEKRVEGVDGLIAMGKKGRDALTKELVGGEAAADFLITHWAKANEIIKKDSSRDLYPLHIAAGKGYVTAAELLLEKGAVVDANDESGYTPLHWAARFGGSSIRDKAVLLIEYGADVDVKDNSGRTPLHRAAGNDNTDIAVFLIEKGADVNAKDDNAWTPLHWAARWNRKNTAALLIVKGADVVSKDDKGRTPLHRAVIWNHIDTTALLIEKGAEVNARDNNGETPLDLARDEEIKYFLRALRGKTGKEIREQEDKETGK